MGESGLGEEERNEEQVARLKDVASPMPRLTGGRVHREQEVSFAFKLLLLVSACASDRGVGILIQHPRPFTVLHALPSVLCLAAAELGHNPDQTLCAGHMRAPCVPFHMQPLLSLSLEVFILLLQLDRPCHAF